jgi:hypothetical protein
VRGSSEGRFSTRLPSLKVLIASFISVATVLPLFLENKPFLAINIENADLFAKGVAFKRFPIPYSQFPKPVNQRLL